MAETGGFLALKSRQCGAPLSHTLSPVSGGTDRTGRAQELLLSLKLELGFQRSQESPVPVGLKPPHRRCLGTWANTPIPRGLPNPSIACSSTSSRTLLG